MCIRANAGFLLDGGGKGSKAAENLSGEQYSPLHAGTDKVSLSSEMEAGFGESGSRNAAVLLMNEELTTWSKHSMNLTGGEVRRALHPFLFKL